MVKKMSISIEDLQKIVDEKKANNTWGKYVDSIPSPEYVEAIVDHDTPTNTPTWDKKPPYKGASYDDPFKNQLIISESNIHMKIEAKDIAPGNNSLVLIYGDKNSSIDFKERVSRLVSCLNLHDTMKAVVVTVVDGEFYAGVTFDGDLAGGVVQETITEIGQRFKQLIEVRDAKAA